jgi:hypothetical protein
MASPPTTSDAVQHWTARLLWEVCRREPRPSAIEEAIANGADLELAVGAAIDHRLAGLLWRGLSTADASGALGSSEAPLRSLVDVYRMEAQLLLPRAVSLALTPLTDIGLEPVVLKGPALAIRYHDLGLRPMEDIDLLLPLRDHTRALAALKAAGWSVARSAEHGAYDTALMHPDVPSFALELHYGLESSSQRVTTLDPVRLWESRQPLDCLGARAFGLPLEEEIVFLAAHAGKPHHSFVRLVWIADFATVVGVAEESGSGVDWARVRQIADDGSCLTVVAAALALAAHAGVVAPDDLFPLPQRGWRGDAIRQLVDVEWPLTHLELPGYHLNYALTDNRALRMRILLVLLGSGHGIGKRFWTMVDAPARRRQHTRRDGTGPPATE